MVSWLLEFYILATSKVTPGKALTWDSAHSRLLYSAVPLGDQATSTMISYPTQSQYPGTEPTSPFPILIMLSAWLESDKDKFSNHWFDSGLTRPAFETARFKSPYLPKRGDGRSTHSAILPNHTTVKSRLEWKTFILITHCVN